MRKSDHGMTILEVVFAITILLMGAGFMAKSNAVTFKYRDQSSKYKQVLFYAAGLMDAIINHQNVEDLNVSEYVPFNSMTVTPLPTVDVPDLGSYLEKVGVEVSLPGERPVILYSYRLK